MEETPRVLSIQSHVVSGYVGNKSAVFPMQLLGFEVDPINSVQFSNHLGYKTCSGQVLKEMELAELVEGLSKNNIDFYTHLLTGYIGAPSFLNQVLNVVQHLKSKNPKLIYVCDPVMGDNGRLYIPQELIPIYKNRILPLVTILTPNLFELEILTDTKIHSPDDVWNAVSLLHDKGCETVVVSSAEFEDSILHIFASSVKATREKFIMKINKLPLNFTGTGDFFAAVLLCWMHKSNGNVKESLEKTVASLQGVLRRTFDNVKGTDATPRNKELKLIQSKSDIEEPKIVYRAEIV